MRSGTVAGSTSGSAEAPKTSRITLAVCTRTSTGSSGEGSPSTSARYSVSSTSVV